MTETLQKQNPQTAASKLPAITAGFWCIKILATTLGETGGDAVSMSMGLGYLAGTAIFAVVFAAAVAAQMRARALHPFLYWFTIIATTTVGTTLADFCTRSLGIGYAGGSLLLLTLLLACMRIWQATTQSLAVEHIRSRRAEGFYWCTIMFSQTLGTALGDWSSDSLDMGYLGSSAIFGGLLALVLAAYLWTRVSRTALFWLAFILTRPFGAVVGDLLDKPLQDGGLALSRYAASATLVAAIVLGIVLTRPRAAGAA